MVRANKPGRQKVAKMDIRQVTETFAVSPQIAVEDVQLIADAGYTTIICNRPNGEQVDQPSVEDIAAKAEELGLTLHVVQVTSGMIGPHHVDQMAEQIDGAEGKVLAYCRSGTRSIMLWAFNEVRKRPRDEVLALTQAAGYDLSQQL